MATFEQCIRESIATNLFSLNGDFFRQAAFKMPCFLQLFILTVYLQTIVTYSGFVARHFCLGLDSSVLVHKSNFFPVFFRKFIILHEGCLFQIICGDNSSTILYRATLLHVV